VIAGKYAIVKVIGEGGMGIVFEATHLRLRQRVAVKMLLPDMLAHEIIVTRFEREARASGQLRNRHAARVMDVDVTPEGLPYMVMEFLEGNDLATELERRGRLPYQEVVDYVLQACSAMMEAHQVGIIHRDLKPANLFLTFESDARDTRIVKVLDFGISKLQTEGDAKLTVADSVMGTAMYMSPEQVRSSRSVDARSDIWSLGIILFELLAGRPPWIGAPTQLAALIVSEDAPDVRTHADVPPEIAGIIAKALQRDPVHRYVDVRQLALALAPFAPPNGAGRKLAEALLHSSSGSFQRFSIRPPRVEEEAQTIVQAAAVSESRMRGGDASGTAPGWAQHSPSTGRDRTLLVGFLVAFGIGLLVVGGLALAWLRWGTSAQRDRAITAQTAASSAKSATPNVSANGVATATAAPTGTATEPLPPSLVLDPAPPVIGRAASPSPLESARAPVAHVPAVRPPTTSHAGAAPNAPPGKPAAAPAVMPATRPTPPAAAKPAPAPSNPLIL
jgi:serine/threonine-protein kinase